MTNTTTPTSTTAENEIVSPFRVGDSIIERHKHADSRVVEEVVLGEYIVAKGFVRSKISWKSLGRYDLVGRRRA